MKKFIKLILGLVLLTTLSSCIEIDSSYEVRFYNEGSVVYTESVDENQVIEPYDLPEKEGYEYEWFRMDNNQKYDFNDSVTRNLNLYAKWTFSNEFVTITFLDDDNITVLEELIVKSGEIPEPKTPTDKYVSDSLSKRFVSWDKELLPAIVSSSYVAVYEEIVTEYQLTWVLSDYESIVRIYNYNEIIELLDKEPMIPGHDFIGWDIEIPERMPNHDLTITAVYNVEKFDVIYLDENNNVVISYEVEYGSLITNEVIDERPGYVAVWLLNDTPYNFNQIITKDITLKLQWISEVDQYNLDVYYLNDTHGAVLKKDGELGLAYIGNYIKQQYNNNPLGSIFITGGDSFQGQLISNDNKGALMVEIFNELKLDAFVVGNHEFDWGIDEILKYFNPNYNGVKANFPILGANIKEQSTNRRPDFIDSHTIIERMGIKIGIIGVIGDGLESSISTLRVKDYYFSDAYQAVKEVSDQIRNEVDVILVVNHSNNQYFNERVAGIDKVAAVFNGHTHSLYTGYLNNKIPYIQSASNGRYVGRVSIELDKSKNFVKGSASNIANHAALNNADDNIERIINNYYNEIKHLYETELLIAKRSLDTNDLANYIAKVMKEATGAVAGFQNNGGTRDTISSGQRITAADIFQIFPFDNQIIYTTVTGSQLKRLLDDSYLYSSMDINYSDIINNKVYVVATNDYIYYSSYQSYAFGGKEGILYGDMYETFYQVMLNLKENGYTHFDTDSPIMLK